MIHLTSSDRTASLGTKEGGFFFLGPTQPAVQWVPGDSYPGIKLTTDLHLVPRLIMRGSVLPLPQYVLKAWYLVKHSDNFTLPFTVLNVTFQRQDLGLRQTRCNWFARPIRRCIQKFPD
jgi:hypothetical protein